MCNLKEEVFFFPLEINKIRNLILFIHLFLKCQWLKLDQRSYTVQGIDFIFLCWNSPAKTKNITTKNPQVNIQRIKLTSSGERKRLSISKVATMDYLKCPAFHNNNNKNMRPPQRKRPVWPVHRKKAGNRICLWEDPDVGLANKDSKQLS